MTLRDYQQDAHDSVISWVRSCKEPCLIEAATGAGKSHVIAAIAQTMHSISAGKHILCLAPSAELVIQNREKYLATGNPASTFSASAGGSCLKHPVVFGTPMTVKNSIESFSGQFCAVVVDEAHGITPTIKTIIESIKNHNENLRVIGLTATPYRLGTGYIYRSDIDGNPCRDKTCKDPYFARLVSQITAHDLIQKGFLSPPVIGAINADNYNTAKLKLNSMGQFNAADIDKAFLGQGRKTADIISDVIDQAKFRNSVLIFASTVRHAKECFSSLPKEISRIVTGETPAKERAQILADFKSYRIKYLVNVAVLTTGFDAPSVDVVALLRATESVGLLQQIIGRGLRVAPNKTDCLILDYAENISRHCPDGDIFNPLITIKEDSGAEQIQVECPDCVAKNHFIPRKNLNKFKIDKNGYFLDLAGFRVSTDDGQPYPAHYGRRCKAEYLAVGGRLVRCHYRWTFKECRKCKKDNDIAARYCEHCNAELVDPNKKLILAYKSKKKDPMQIQCDKILAMYYAPTMARSGRECIKADYVTEYRSFSVWYVKGVAGRAARALSQFQLAIADSRSPTTVTYRKQASGFYETLDFNQPEDKEPADENTGVDGSVRRSDAPQRLSA
jgi:DNA repair protein RadD